MKRFESDYATRTAEKRKLRIYATDPMSGRRAPYRITEVENEPDLSVGPVGEIVEVIDYDGWNKKFYRAVDLNHPALLIEAGLAPSESDPRFHQTDGLCGGHEGRRKRKTSTREADQF